MANKAPETIEINGTKYKIIRGLNFRPAGDDTKYMSRYKFFEVASEHFFMNGIAAMYLGVWAVGENFYDVANKLEAKLFAQNRKTFLGMLDKTKGRAK